MAFLLPHSSPNSSFLFANPDLPWYCSLQRSVNMPRNLQQWHHVYCSCVASEFLEETKKLKTWSHLNDRHRVAHFPSSLAPSCPGGGGRWSLRRCKVRQRGLGWYQKGKVWHRWKTRLVPLRNMFWHLWKIRFLASLEDAFGITKRYGLVPLRHVLAPLEDAFSTTKR